MRTQLTSTTCDSIVSRGLALLAGAMAAGVALCFQAAPALADSTKIGIIYEARPADQPWSAAIADAADKLAKAHPDYKLLQSYKAFDPTAAEPIARQMIQQGVSVLDLHSFALNDVAHNLAKDYPKVAMSVSSFSPPVQPNLNVGTVSYLEVGYSDCWLLAKISKSHKIGFLGAMPIPYETELLKGCQLGAAAAHAGTEIVASYANSFDNQQATREQGQALLDKGADVLFPSSATQDSLGGFQLCEQKKVACVGWASEIRRYAPTYGVASAVVDWSVLLQRLVEQSKQANMTASTFDAAFDNGGIVAQPFKAADAAIVPAEVQQGYMDVLKQLARGKIDLPKSVAHPCCR